VRLNVFPVSLAVADLNGDGRLDIVVGNQLVSPALSILLGRGDGTFQAGPVVPIPRLQMGINGVLAADFNRDGRTDLAIATSNYVLILLGQGDATFKTSLLAGVGNSPRSVTTGDFNGDGFPDLATGNYEAGTVSVLINNSAARHCQNRTNRYSVERDSDELLANRERDVLAHTLHRCRPLP